MAVVADPRFFTAAGPFTLAQLAEIAAAQIGGAPASRPFRGIATLEAAGPDELTFLDNRRYIDAFTRSRAGACIVHPDLASRAPDGMALLLTAAPYKAFAMVAAAFHPEPARIAGVHATATVDPAARLGAGVRVDAGASIAANAEIGERCWIGSNVTIGAGVILGADCRIGANASLAFCVLGSRIVIYPGVRIGQDGFGFATDAGQHIKVP